MIQSFLRRRFHGVQQPIGRWILRHVAEFILLSPMIVPTWIWLRVGKREVRIVGKGSSVISMFLAPLEPELRRRSVLPGSLKRLIVLNLSVDANSQLRKMYDEIVTIYGSKQKFRRRIIWWASQLGIPRKDLWETQSDPIWVTGLPSVRLTPEEIVRGEAFLEEIGIDKHQSFICYTVRSESYYLKRIEEGVILKPRSVRNPSEVVYLQVAAEMCRNGVPVIRMGKDLDTSISEEIYPGVIDYAKKYRSDFLDIFLLSRCKFLFSGGSGIVWFRWLFNLPAVFCDNFDIRRTQMNQDLTIFQKVWLSRENRFASISEMLKMRNQYSQETHQERLGVKLVRNTFEEISTVCDEMNARIDGLWKTTADDEILQHRYHALVAKYSDLPNQQGGGRIGAAFLRENADLLR